MWHRRPPACATLHGEGKVSVIPAIGYDHPDQSHFTSRHFWEVGATRRRRPLRLDGPLPRPPRRRRQPAAGPVAGLRRSSPALAAADVPVAAVAAPDDFGLWAPGVGDPLDDADARARSATLGRAADARPASARRARLVATEVDDIRAQLAPFRQATASPASRARSPTRTATSPHRLAALAAMLARGLPIRCVAIDAPGGYDTHSDQAGSLGTTSRPSDALLAFQRDLEARGIADRVLIQVWSEFGRRPQENGSRHRPRRRPAARSSSARRPRAR